MQKPSFDPGLTQTYAGNLQRVINKDGGFNVYRTGFTWRDIHPYLLLVNLSWSKFLLVVLAFFLVVNVMFAAVFMMIGPDCIYGAKASSYWLTFLNIAFFSSHTLTTVGYGNMYPVGVAANAVASFEALMGLLAFALATGLLFGRFARPSARIGFSRNMVVAPYGGDGISLQFRVVNRRQNNLINLEARMTLMTVEEINGRLGRKFLNLELERTEVLFFPLTWTVVHPIDENSPLWGKTKADVEGLRAELLIQMRGFDDTFGQIVHSRHSYRYDEIVWGARFVPAFDFDKNGVMHVEVNKVGQCERAALPEIRAPQLKS
ncbi:MAG TPA: ion channel [Bryobacteraceae bacterium]|jgi:inward rectifier potassium channel|nr:ion channel [Bryobacteraceae bacterium]